jgi:hypothetical protein
VSKSSGGGGGSGGGSSGGRGRAAASIVGREMASRSEAEAWSETHFRTWQGSLTRAEANAVENYTGNYFIRVNGKLRGTWKTSFRDVATETNQQIRDLDSSLGKASLPEAMTVFRGARMDASQFKVGGTFSDKGFMSTSLRPTELTNFSKPAVTIGGMSTDGKSAIAFKLTLPKGARAAGLPTNKMEMEVLVDRGSTFRITHVDRAANGATVVHAQLEAQRKRK